MLGLIICGVSVASLVIVGYVLKHRNIPCARGVFMGALSFSGFLLILGAILTITSNPALAQTAAESTKTGTSVGMGFIAAALSTGLACIGAGIAVGSVGSAALGLIGEKPDMLGKTLIYLGLAEGIAIYGMLISILILFG